jgi:hypothetical protein
MLDESLLVTELLKAREFLPQRTQRTQRKEDEYKNKAFRS